MLVERELGAGEHRNQPGQSRGSTATRLLLAAVGTGTPVAVHGRENEQHHQRQTSPHGHMTEAVRLTQMPVEPGLPQLQERPPGRLGVVPGERPVGTRRLPQPEPREQQGQEDQRAQHPVQYGVQPCPPTDVHGLGDALGPCEVAHQIQIGPGVEGVPVGGFECLCQRAQFLRTRGERGIPRHVLEVTRRHPFVEMCPREHSPPLPGEAGTFQRSEHTATRTPARFTHPCHMNEAAGTSHLLH